MSRVSDGKGNQGSLSEVQWQGASHMGIEGRGIPGRGNSKYITKITQLYLRNNLVKPWKMPLTHFLNDWISQEKMSN